MTHTCKSPSLITCTAPASEVVWPPAKAFYLSHLPRALSQKRFASTGAHSVWQIQTDEGGWKQHLPTLLGKKKTPTHLSAAGSVWTGFISSIQNRGVLPASPDWFDVFQVQETLEICSQSTNLFCNKLYQLTDNSGNRTSSLFSIVTFTNSNVKNKMTSWHLLKTVEVIPLWFTALYNWTSCSF